MAGLALPVGFHLTVPLHFETFGEELFQGFACFVGTFPQGVCKPLELLLHGGRSDEDFFLLQGLRLLDLVLEPALAFLLPK